MTLVYRKNKGVELSYAELDGNFQDLDERKADLAGADFIGPISAIAIDNTPIGQTTPAAGKFSSVVSSGSVGIGTSDADITGGDRNMHVKAATTAAIVQVSNSDETSSLALYSGISASDNPAILYQNDLRFGHTTGRGTAGFVEAGRFDASGNLLVGLTNDGAARVVTSGISSGLPSSSGSAAEAALRIRNGFNTPVLDVGVDTDSTNSSWIQARRSSDYSTYYNLLLQPNGGKLAIGTSAIGPGTLTVYASSAGEGASVAQFDGPSNFGTYFYTGATSNGVNSADTVIKVAANSVTGRSFNAGGTINASGADYAEYMRKAAGCDDIAKGAIVGVNADGLLTDKWSESVSFLIKSTNPSYVGGDVWGSNDALGMSRPVEPKFTPPEYAGAANPGDAPEVPEVESDEYRAAFAAWDSARATYELDQAAYSASVAVAQKIFDTATYPTYQQQLETFNATLEAARQKVDRIAYAGQVPVNVAGATAGQYIVPVEGPNDTIIGILVDDASVTFEQYRRAVGIVQNILPDGRANVRVKVV